MMRPRPAPGDQSGRWLSREFAELLSDPGKCHRTPALDPAYDIVIVGSGYGGAVAAAELAGCTEEGRALRVCVLERGREYLPGAFPSQLADLPAQLRGNFGGQPRGGEGLFDIRAGRDLGLLVANGLGGGSLINAGVMEVPRPEVFDRRWPAALQDGTALDSWYVKAKALLGASHEGVDNRIGQHRDLQGGRLAKTRVLDMLGRGAMRESALTVAMRDGPSTEGVELSACKLCGDCVTGCNYGAKESLDTNLLVRAARFQADIWCGATVLRLQRPAEHAQAWSLELVHTDPKLRLQDAGPRWLTARRVILAAGTLGSSEILMRTQRRATRTLFSARLGQGFSGNGDLIAFGYGYGSQAQANAVADEDQPPGLRRVGPTITGVIDTRLTQRPDLPAQQIVVEEMAVPGSLRRAAEESITTASTLHDLACFDDTEHDEGHPAGDPFAVQRERIRHMSVFAAMGDDGAGGSLELTGDADAHTGDGHVSVVWPELPHHPLFDAQMLHIDALRAAAGVGGRTLPNPLWRFMPESMDFLVQGERGPAVSVHPLGGCAMADDVACGVVDDYGRVFDPARSGQPRDWHEGLVVLDGSVLCSALGTNPALTIAAVALRAVEALRRDWGCEPPRSAGAAPLQSRPRLADTEQTIIERSRLPRAGTQVAVCERLAGPVSLRDAQGSRRDCWVELTLGYQPLALRHLFRPDETGRLGKARLELGDEGPAQLRIFPLREWQRLKAEVLSVEERLRREQRLARVYRVKGSLVVVKREASGFLQRTARGSRAWWYNRGLRDAGLGLTDWARKVMAGERSDGPRMARRIWGMFKLASRAGECRRFDYELQIAEELTPDDVKAVLPLADLVGGDIRGHKHITYARPSNPWRQLQELSLTQIGGRLEGLRLLTLDPQYLVARGRPLMRIESQDCHVEALVDFASLAAFFARMLLTIHVWNLRKPDTPRHRLVQRLPGKLPGLPAPEIHWLDLGQAGDVPLRLRLACYRNARQGVTANPVLLIHGYSASGTSYAHPALEPSLAARLAESGRDVWVADLRSSAGLPTASLPWTFEQVALNDIPAAVDYIWKRSGQQALDVVAHCMGAVMLSQAILSAGKEGMELERLLRPRDPSTDSGADRHAVARRALPQRLRRVVLSQNGPVMVMSQQNIFRGYVMSYLEQLFGPLRYGFRPEPDQGLGMELLDRFLGSLPYSDDELRQENPWLPCRTEYLASRHRMDAIYGRTFSLGSVSRRVLDHIDDLFGPLNLDTVAQVIHFTRHQVITDRSGRNRFVSREGLRTHWRFRTLVLHGQDNGLADVATAHRAEAVLRDAGCKVEKRILPGMGHQDSLIGRRAGETCAQILDFLDAREMPDERPADPPSYVAESPWLGPMLNLQCPDAPLLGLGASPQLGRPEKLCMLPVELDSAGCWRYADLMHRLKLGPEDILFSLDGKDTDWFSHPLPRWAREVDVQHLLLLPLYPQPPFMNQTVLDTADGLAAQRLWPGRPLPPGEELASTAMADAIEQAVSQINREGPASPPGLVRVPLATARDGLRLALGSCGYPPGILNEYPPSRAWDLLNDRLDGTEPPQLLVLAGDQIYADATAGLFDPTLADDRYRKPYETWLHGKSVRRALGRVPLVCLPDDHELEDNWEPLAPDAPTDAAQRNQDVHERGLRYFLRYQRLRFTTTAEETLAEPLWRAFEAEGIPVFLLDTRSRRLGRHGDAGFGAAGLLGAEQWQALRRWLLEGPRDRPRLIVSPAILLPRHRYAMPACLAFGRQDESLRACRRSDGWDGYPETLLSLLELIGEQQLRGLVFLSGDEHLGMFTTARLRRPGSTQEIMLHSIHTAGLNTPYRFANADAAELAQDETLRFEGVSGPWECEIGSRAYGGAGFTQLSLQPEPSGRWQLHCEFSTGDTGAQPVGREVRAILDLS